MTTEPSAATQNEPRGPFEAVLATIPGRAGRLLGAGITLEIAGILLDAYWHTVLDIHEVGIVLRRRHRHTTSRVRPVSFSGVG